MLENSPRPEWLKKRIREIGHLSNHQCAEFVGEIVQASTEPPRSVMLAHISQQCNTNELAQQATTEVLARTGAPSVRVHESFKDLPSAIVTF
jgi:phosphoribosyl 1,2-cyclic phosphodiesterase